MLTKSGESYSPEIGCFQRLIEHSYHHENIKMIIDMRDFKKIYEVFRDNVNEIFGDEESRFDYLCTRVEELDSKMYSDLFLLGSKDSQGDQSHRFLIDLNTKIFTEQFIDLKKCEDCNACLTTTYSYPVHKHMINNYMPEDPTALPSVYCDLMRIEDLKISQNADIGTFLKDKELHSGNNQDNIGREGIMRYKNKINSEIEKEKEKAKKYKNDLLDDDDTEANIHIA